MRVKEQTTRATSSPRARPSWLLRLLLALPAESAHNLAVSMLRAAQSTPALGVLARRYRGPDTSGLDQRQLLGLRFRNPIGLAAGFDKDAVVVPGMSALGFGWLEVGAVTPKAQPGNPRPRLFRYPAAGSLENAMGFNNRGAEAMRRRLARVHPAEVPLLVNLGKNRATPSERAVDDYLQLINRLEGHCDGFVLNVSSPNTPGLRNLQQPERVRELVSAARAATESPMLVKLSPDLDSGEALQIAEECVTLGAQGIIVANTTTDYSLLPAAKGVGGLSGRVLRQRSLELLQALAPALFGRAVLVSVGGISSAQDVYRRLKAGAHLVQVYTALVYQGPSLVLRFRTELLALMARDNISSIEEAIGLDLP